jgi:tetratricopeptide (TPR) repeat protein
MRARAARAALCSMLMSGSLLFAPRFAAAQESRLDALRNAATAAPNDAGSALALGTALRRAGHLADAQQELRRGLNLTSGRSGDTAIMLQWEQARVAIARADFGQAMVGCRVVGALPQGTIPGHACAAEAHLLWKRASEALVETGQALANGAGSQGKLGAYEAKVAEGLAEELEVKDAEAEATFREAIAWKPGRWEAHMWLGRLLIRVLKHDDGVAELRKTLQLDPDGPEANYELARTLPAGPECATLLQKAVHERPSFILAWLRLADVDLELHRLSDARAAAEAVIKLDPREGAAHIIAGKVALTEGRPDDALREGQAALAILANSAHAKLLVADAYAAKGEIDLAVENYQAAYGLDHMDPTSLVHASEACHAQGRDTSARAFGEKATKEFPQWGPGWVALGDALAGQHETALARTAYQTALKASGPVDTTAVQRKLAALR